MFKKMMGKRVWVLLAAIALLLAATTLCACDSFGNKTQQNAPKPQHEHDYVYFEEVPSTCTENGTIAHYYCEGCDAYFDLAKNKIFEFQTVIGKKPHSFEEVVDSAATCSKKAHKHQECIVCGLREKEEDFGETLPHTWDGKEFCAVCGVAKPYIVRDGYYYFGQYPQTKVVDNGIVNVLSGMTGDTPSQNNRGKWTAYGYFKGYSNNRPYQKSFMWYIDLEYLGEKYRGVYMNEYRLSEITKDCTWSNQEGNGYLVNELYFFKYEPIKWRVLQSEGDKVMLFSDLVLDSQHYYRGDRPHYDSPGVPIYPNNFRRSDILNFLRGDFWAWAFDDLAQSVVLSGDIACDASTMRIDDLKVQSHDLQEEAKEYSLAPFKAEAFLLSYKDIVTADYGFSKNDEGTETRKLKVTDYAACQGVRMDGDGYGGWWLRSPYVTANGGTLGQTVAYVNGSGEVHAIRTYRTDIGVAPALRLDLYEDDVTPAA